MDDPAVREDGRFWVKVPEELADFHKRPVGTILPTGQSLASWRERADGEEVEVSNPLRAGKERVSLARWSEADPDRTYVIHLFLDRPEEMVGRSPEEVERIRGEGIARRGARRVIKPKLSAEAKRLKAEQADLQRQYREARDRGDEQRMAELSVVLDAKTDALCRADFPNFTRGWDFSGAIRPGPEAFILDWTTGY